MSMLFEVKRLTLLTDFTFNVRGDESPQPTHIPNPVHQPVYSSVRQLYNHLCNSQFRFGCCRV